jgi:two-component system LytT family response regulator
VDQTLIELMQKLPSHFIRIQKSYVINKEKVKEVQKHFNGRYLFLMEDKAESRLLSGLTFYETIKEELGLS